MASQECQRPERVTKRLRAHSGRSRSRLASSAGSAMIDFTTVSREFRGLVERRRELFTFLGSVFAAMGLFLQNTLQGGLPASLGQIQQHVFAFYALMLMVLSLILALRMATLHGGMVLNGILYARLMQEQDFTRKGNPLRAG